MVGYALDSHFEAVLAVFGAFVAVVDDTVFLPALFFEFLREVTNCVTLGLGF